MRVGKFVYLPLPLIIDKYLSLGRGLLNYYSCADNLTRLEARITYILKYSCILTFASKMRLYTMKKVIKKFGYNLIVKQEVKGQVKEVARFEDGMLSPSSKSFKLSGMKDYDPLSVIDLAVTAIPRTRKLFEGQCSVCGSNNKLEVHHIKHLNKGAKGHDYLTSLQIRMNRKQILLCQECHNKVHQGRHIGSGL